MFDFEGLWKSGAWRKIGKDAAFRHFKAQVKSERDWIRIQVAANEYAKEAAATRKRDFDRGARGRELDAHILHGSTFFNNRWRDYAEMADDSAELRLDDPEPPLFRSIMKNHKHWCAGCLPPHEWECPVDPCLFPGHAFCSRIPVKS